MTLAQKLAHRMLDEAYDNTEVYADPDSDFEWLFEKHFDNMCEDDLPDFFTTDLYGDLLESSEIQNALAEIKYQAREYWENQVAAQRELEHMRRERL